MLERIGRACARHRWWVIGGWLLILVALLVPAAALGTQIDDDFSIPGTDSQRALTVLEEDFPALAGAGANVVYQAPDGKKISDYSDAIDQTVTNLGKLDDVQVVGNPNQVPALVSSDGTIAYSPVTYDVSAPDLPKQAFDDLEAAADPATKAGLNVQIGGGVPDAQNLPTSLLSDYADEIGLAIAVVVLLVAFGSVLHMALPIGTAVFGVIAVNLAIILLGHGISISTVAPILASMLGLGVGIDYSLFLVTRCRQNLEDGMAPIDAIGNGVGTAGRAVVFACLTVCTSAAALVLVRIPMVQVMGIVTALAVLMVMVVVLTLLPALLSLSGTKLMTVKIPHLGPSQKDDGRLHGFGRLASNVADRPWLFLIAGLLVMVVLAIPLLSMRTGFTDDGEAPKDTTQRQAYDLLDQGFGAGFNGPLLVVAETNPDDDDTSATQALQQAVAGTDGVDSAQGPLPSPNKKAAIIIVTPKTGPAEPATESLVGDLRDSVIPDAVKGTNLSASVVHVGGPTAINIDLTERVNRALIPFMAIVITISFFLLMMVFRSVLVPLKAAIMNLLSIGAAYGIVVAVFQWGWGKQIIGLDETIAIWSFVPLIMFAILFGLSMDYEVFLMSRVHEEYLRTGETRQSVVRGVGTTARVITAAALVMIAVFLSYVTNPSPVVKMLGLGLAAAVFVDATVVRLLLVPAVMELLGHRAWWFPHWMDRLLPRIKVEGPDPTPDTSAPVTSAPDTSEEQEPA